MTPATFRQRAIARCVDIGVLFLLTVGALAGFVEEQPNGESTVSPPEWWVVLLIVAALAYEIVPVHTRGQTPGKMFMRIRVVPVGDESALPGWGASWLRWIIPALMLVVSAAIGPIVLPLLAVVYGSALLDRGGRSWLDKLAGTRVVQAG